MIQKSKAQRDVLRSLLFSAFMYFSLLALLLITGMYARTFPSGYIVGTVIQMTLFIGGTLGFLIVWDLLKKIVRYTEEFLPIKIRFLERLHEVQNRMRLQAPSIAKFQIITRKLSKRLL